MNNIFQITAWDETSYIKHQDGSKKSHAKITQNYQGIIAGSSEVQFLMSYQSKTSALFVGFEVITGQINGKSGRFTLQHSGRFENGVASSNFVIVPNSGTEELIKIEGSGSFKSGESGQASYELTLVISP